jgi:hypothetical protein
MFTTDGKQFVYGVFGADGCECESLEAVFNDEESAVAYLRKAIEAAASGDYAIYGYPEHATVKQIEVGQRIDPLSNNVVWPDTQETRR